jgi:hypothetical protein
LDVGEKEMTENYCSVRFRKPGHKGETWYVSVHKMGGGPYTAKGIDLSIPTTFRVDVLQQVVKRYRVYTLFEATEKIKLQKLGDFPLPIQKRLFKKAEAFCNAHGYVNADSRWKK